MVVRWALDACVAVRVAWVMRWRLRGSEVGLGRSRGVDVAPG
jgi:hypothetical protein